jgi:Bacteriocin-protection, YdeI or OmpD-Associated/Domain of unknown function (DUF1905)
MRFTATLQQAGKTATGFEVPPEVVDSFDAGRKPAVKVTIQGHTYRSTVASRSGRYLVGVSAENREAAGVAAGDVLDIDLELDTEPRRVEVPEDLAARLDSDPKARDFFATLSYSAQQGYVQPIVTAKKPETRERRLAKAMEGLRAGRKR